MKSTLLNVLINSVAILVSGLSTTSSFQTLRHHSLLTSSTTRLFAAITLDGQEIRGPITPLGNFVLVRTKETLAATSGGILLPDQVRAQYSMAVYIVITMF